jgi:hypothetical protein
MNDRDWVDLRVLPPLVVHLVLEATLLVFTFLGLGFKDFSLVEKLMMKTESLLVFFELRFWSGGRHDGSKCQKRGEESWGVV